MPKGKTPDGSPDVGRVDFRAIIENRSATFADRRTRRARTRADRDRREIRLQD